METKVHQVFRSEVFSREVEVLTRPSTPRAVHLPSQHLGTESSPRRDTLALSAIRRLKQF